MNTGTEVSETLRKQWEAAATRQYQIDPIGYTIPELSKWMRSQIMAEAMKNMGITNRHILLGKEGTARFVIDERGLGVHQNGKRYNAPSRTIIEVFCGENSAAKPEERHPECLVPFLKQAVAKILKSSKPRDG